MRPVRLPAVVLLLLAPLLASLLAAPPAGAVTLNVMPTLTCVVGNSDGTYTAKLGYTSLEALNVTIPLGGSNYVQSDSGSPLQPNQGQPYVFLPGSHSAAFTVDTTRWTTYSWWLDSRRLQVDWDTAPRCPGSDTVLTEPTLVGTPAVGSTITFSGERAALAGAGYGASYVESVAWFRGCDTAAPEQVGTDRSYTVAPADAGHRLQAVVDLRDPYDDSGVTFHTPCDAGALAGAPPALSATPTLAGSNVVGQTLSVGIGGLTGTAPIAVTTRWESCDPSGCVDAGSGPQHLVTADDVGRTVRAVSTATSAWGTATRTSAPTATVLAAESGSADLAPAALAFTARVGTRAPTRAVTYTNGTNRDRRLAAVGVTGDGFVRDGGDCYARVVLAPGESCTVGVAFSPRATGPATGQVTVDDGTARTVGLTGTAAPGGRLRLSATALDVGVVRVHDRSRPRTLRASNTGTQAFGVTSTGLRGRQRRDFTVLGDTCSGATLRPGESCTVTVAMTPRRAGRREASLLLRTTAPDGVRQVRLSGRGR